MAGASVGLAGVASASAPVPGAIVLHCTGVPGELQQVIDGAASGSTINVDGTCAGGVFINKNLTLAGPATIDAANTATAVVVWYGSVVVLNDLTLQHGNDSTFQIGGGLSNNGQTTLNRSIVKESTAMFGGGIFNTGQLTLNNSTVADNTANTGGGIYNCGGLLGFDCGGVATLTLNNSSVSDNVVTNGNGGGIFNDQHAVMALSNSTVSGNTAGGGGGLVNNGTATVIKSTLSGNTGFSGGAINNGVNNDGSGVPTASLTISNSTLQGNTATLLGGAVTTSGSLTIDHATVSDNSAGPFTGFGFVDAGFGGAIFIFSQATTVSNSTFSNNPATSGFDSPAGIFVKPSPGTGTFSATHSTFS
jgi:hypothetical protein